MSNYPIPPPIPPRDDDPEVPLVTRESDDKRVLDPDASDDLVDSIDADRLAAEADTDD